MANAEGGALHAVGTSVVFQRRGLVANFADVLDFLKVNRDAFAAFMVQRHNVDAAQGEALALDAYTNVQAEKNAMERLIDQCVSAMSEQVQLRKVA